MEKTNIEQLCSYLKNDKAKAYPISNEMLEIATDFVVNGYMKMLGVVLQQASEITDAQLSIYKRIVGGVKSENKAEDYLRMALSIEIDDFISFTSEIKELLVKYRFIFDAILLSCVSGNNTEQLELVAEFAEALGIEKEEMRYLATMAKAVLCINTSAYVDADEIKPDSIPENTFFGYIRLLSNDCIMKNKNLTIFQPTCEEEVTVEKLQRISTSDTPCIKLSNVKVDLSEFPLKFENHKRVVLDGCEFIGGDKYTIEFFNCKKVIIVNSCFKEFGNRTIHIHGHDSDNVKIVNTRFKQCILKHGTYNSCESLGGVIGAWEMNINKPIMIDNCIFDECGDINSYNYCSNNFICNHTAEVNNSQFVNCWDRCGRYGSNTSQKMFNSDSKSVRCTFDNSAVFS